MYARLAAAVAQKRTDLGIKAMVAGLDALCALLLTIAALAWTWLLLRQLYGSRQVRTLCSVLRRQGKLAYAAWTQHTEELLPVAVAATVDLLQNIRRFLSLSQVLVWNLWCHVLSGVIQATLLCLAHMQTVARCVSPSRAMAVAARYGRHRPKADPAQPGPAPEPPPEHLGIPPWTPWLAWLGDLFRNTDTHDAADRDAGPARQLPRRWTENETEALLLCCISEPYRSTRGKRHSNVQLAVDFNALMSSIIPGYVARDTRSVANKLRDTSIQASLRLEGIESNRRPWQDNEKFALIVTFVDFVRDHPRLVHVENGRLESFSSEVLGTFLTVLRANRLLRDRTLRDVMCKLKYLSQYPSQRAGGVGVGAQGLYFSNGRWSYVLPTRGGL
jgi:hypothetical protein